MKKRDADTIFLMTSGKQMSNNYVPCFNRNNFVLIHFFIELLCQNYASDNVKHSISFCISNKRNRNLLDACYITSTSR